MQNVKLIVLGNKCAGKTALMVYSCIQWRRNEYIDPKSNTVNVIMDDKTFCLDIFNLSGLEDYDRLRPLSYPQTDVFLVCYSIESRDSFEDIRGKWYPEISHHCPDTPILLVACKTDLRSTSSHKNLITTNQGQKLANELGVFFCETSAHTNAGLKECFETAVKCVVDNRMAAKKRGRKCSIV